MKVILGIFALISLALHVKGADQCAAVALAERKDCGSSQFSCEETDCCWQITPGAPYCFYPSGGPVDPVTTNPVGPTSNPVGPATDTVCKAITNEDKMDCAPNGMIDGKAWSVPLCIAKGCCHMESPGAPTCFLPHGLHHDPKCSVVALADRKDCGDATTTPAGCEDKGCCWQMTPGAPFCFHPSGGPIVNPTSDPHVTSGPSNSSDTKVYIHMMPWFETKATNGGKWGQHWTMANINPDIMSGGKRNIASKFYPLIDLYASGDSHVIDWQLGLMKLAGVSGVLIDWPGTANVWTYPTHLANCEAIIKGCDRVGLEFAIVYEDHNLGKSHDAGVLITDILTQGKADMAYIRDRYFTKSNYIKVNGAPLLLDFGPQTLKSGSQWETIFSVFTQKPTFLTIWNQMQEAGASAQGEFAWIYSNYLDGLNNFYKFRNINLKMGVAYPGFDSAYVMGGWDGPTWIIPVSVATFEATLNAAINGGSKYIQIATWNDYGEGTMVEPTKEFGYGFLVALQKKLGVPHTQADLEKVTANYHARKVYYDNSTMLAHLEKSYFELVNKK